MNQPIQDIIHRRYSCRSYTNEPIQKMHRHTLEDLLKTQQIGPLGTPVRFDLAASSDEDRSSLKGLGTYGFIKNPTGFIIGAIEQNRHNLEDYGYLLEYIVLAATDMGLGTCWLGGSFTKSSFAEKIDLRDSEIIPAVIATGYAADSYGSREFIRRHFHAHRRLPLEQLFFLHTFGNALTSEAADMYKQVLEMVRLAPSASNKQPWRIVRINDAWHFYLQRTKGYGKGTLLFNFLRLADLQRVDMGIALCHFEFTARSLGLSGHWIIEDPKLKTPESAEYTVTWINE
jgi:nitroreductase